MYTTYHLAGSMQFKSATPGWRRHGDMYTTYHIAGSMQFKVGDSRMKTSWRHVYDISSCRQYAIQSRRLQDEDSMATCIRHIILHALWIFKNGASKMKTSWRHVYNISSCRQYAIQKRGLQDEDIMATHIRHIILQAVCSSKSATPK